MALQLTSAAFQEGAVIPAEYTCDGKNISPPVAWTAPPARTKSFALICDDPDAPAGTWVHWVIYNIPSAARSLPKGFPSDQKLPDGTLQGRTDFQTIGYGGPCPPGGTHRYFFKLYALDDALSLGPGATKAQVERSMKSHILEQAQLMGTYRR